MIWEEIFRTLKRYHIDVYPPYQKETECVSPYTVVKYDGSAQVQDFSSEFDFYHFMIYVPDNKYHMIQQYEERVRSVIDRELFPTLMRYGSSMPDYHEEEIHAYMRSFIYRNARRNRFI